jgi:acyl-CoA synthetase (AMP-forming)/AMP-acid ligase II
VHTVAHALLAHPKLHKGSHVAIYAPNDYRISILQLALNRADMLWLSVHIRSALETNIECLHYLDCECVFFHSQFEADVPRLAGGLPLARTFICIDGPSAHGPSLEQWAAGHAGRFEGGIENPLSPAFLQLTGGTTGPSKAAVHTHHSLEATIVTMYSSLEIGPQSRGLVAAPITHAAGLLMCAFFARGAANVIHRGFEAGAVLATIEQEKISHLFLPPTALYALLDHPTRKDYDYSSLRALMIGAAPTAPERFREAIQTFGPVLYEVFGQVESLFPVLVKTPRDYLRADGTRDESIYPVAGRQTALSRVEIMADDGTLLGAGVPGEVVVQSSMLMSGYYKKPQETEETRAFGWHHTGDIGVKDSRGFITIVDRKKDMIISGGFNIYPTEVEAAILGHPAILECAVIGIPDEKWGEAVTAIVACRRNANVTADEIIALCKRKLGSLKAPKSVEIWPELPHSAVGKILKREIRAGFWKGRDRAI